jgi:hypothetical protein
MTYKEPTPNLGAVIARLLKMPRDFHQLGNMSFYDLLRHSGYCDLHQKITETDIAREITAQRNYLDEWMQYSENKRTNGGWYIAKRGDGSWELGQMAVASSEKAGISFSDPISAIAAFVKREAESVRLEG